MDISGKLKKRMRSFLTYFILILASAGVIFPLLITLLSAFKAGNMIAFRLDVKMNWTLDHFVRLFTETYFGRWYLNTAVIGFFTVFFQVSVVVLAGYTYSRFRFVGRKQSLKLFLIVQMVPTMAAFSAFYVMALLLGGLDHYWFLVLIYVGGGIPMNTWLMKGYFDTVPISLDEAAKIEGAGKPTVFWKIVLPLVKPMIAVQVLWAFMSPFGEYMLAKFLLRSRDALTVAVGLQTFVAEPRTQKVALFAAGAILTSLPVIVMFFYLQKNFIGGLVGGAAKE